jgi:hypothetical protein
MYNISSRIYVNIVINTHYKIILHSESSILEYPENCTPWEMEARSFSVLDRTGFQRVYPSMKWDVVYNALALQHQICCRNVHLHIEVEYNMAPQAYNVDLVNEPLVEG